MTLPSYRTRTALCTVAATLLIAAGCGDTADNGASTGEGDSSVLIFASVPADQPAALQQAHQPLLDMLVSETGKEILFQTGRDYAAIIEGLRTGEIDIAAVGPLAYVQAKQLGAPITVVAVRVDEKGGKPGYEAYGITRTGSPIKSLADFRGKKVCFVDPSSASGYLYPKEALLKVGIDPETDTVQSFSGRHDAVVLAVANGQCDAGFALDRIVDQRLIEEGRLQPGQITKVWTTPETVPGPPIVIADHLAAQLRQQLTKALQQQARADYLREHGFCQGECAIADGVAYGYKRIDDAYYNGIREICRRIRDNSCTGN